MKKNLIPRQRVNFAVSVGIGMLCLAAFGCLCGLPVHSFDFALAIITSVYFSFMTSNDDPTISINAVMLLCLIAGMQVMPSWLLALFLFFIIIFYSRVIEGDNGSLTSFFVLILLGCGAVSWGLFALAFWLVSLI